MKIGIIGAMEIEIAEIADCMTDKNTVDAGHLHFTEGFIGKTPVVLVKSGVGKVNAGICAQTLIREFQVTHVINTGVAGGIAKELSVMDTVVSTDAQYHDFNAVDFGYKMNEIPGLGTVTFPADGTLIKLAEETYAKGLAEGTLKKKLVKGRIATGDLFVNSSAKKAEISSMCSPACVEMEGAAIAQTCYLNKVPFVILRSISDLAENTTEVYLEKEAAHENAYLVLNMINSL